MTLVGDMAVETWSQSGACTVIAKNNNRGAARLGRRVNETALVLATLVSVGPDGTWMFWPLEQGSAEIIEVARLRGVGVGGAGAWRWWRGHGDVAAAGVGGRRGAAGAVHRLPAVQGVHGQFIDRVLDISVVLREGTHSANCAEDRTCGRRPCDQQRQVPTVQGFESSSPRFSSSSEW